MVLRVEIGYKTRKKAMGMKQEVLREKETKEHGGGYGGLRTGQVEGEEAKSLALDSLNFRQSRLPHRSYSSGNLEFRGA